MAWLLALDATVNLICLLIKKTWLYIKSLTHSSEGLVSWQFRTFSQHWSKCLIQPLRSHLLALCCGQRTVETLGKWLLLVSSPTAAKTKWVLDSITFLQDTIGFSMLQYFWSCTVVAKCFENDTNFHKVCCLSVFRYLSDVTMEYWSIITSIT